MINTFDLEIIVPKSFIEIKILRIVEVFHW